MYLSKHNIVSKIKDSEEYFIVNILTGNADIINSSTAEQIKNNNIVEFREEFIEKGYLIDKEEESKLYKQKYLDFVDEREKDELQLFFAPTYICNFACSYCYQDEYNQSPKELNTEIIDAFFDYVNKNFAGRKKYITLFGGEPFLNGDRHKKMIKYFIDKAIENDLDLAIVTNGYLINEYFEIIKRANIREIQITLDGTAEIHNKRRPLKNKNENTFNKIVDNIDLCLKNNISVNLRMVIDKENIDNIVELAYFAIDKKWTSNALFKTQIGRNYELHHCQVNRNQLFTRISLYESLYNLIEEYPHITEFYKPAFSISKFLFENEELPNPLFDSCPACKSEWAFDYQGNIYSCTATVGKKEELLGTFYPEQKLDKELANIWAERDVLSIKDCRDCSLQLACGGGCASVAKNKTNNINSPDCRPVKELLEIGMKHYFL